MSVTTFKGLLLHKGHNIEIATYQKDGVIYNVAVECLDCYEVIMDFDNPVFEEDADDSSEFSQ